MQFNTINNIYTGFDGKMILRAVIDKPQDCAGRRFDFLNTLSDTCESFASEKLYSRLSQAYRDSYGSENRFIPYCYNLKMRITYSDDRYLSVIVLATLRRGANVLSAEILSVIFCNDQIIPPKLIVKKRNKEAALVIDKNGIPCWAVIENEAVILNKAERYRFPI